MLMLLGSVLTTNVLAQNTLQDITYAPLSGDKVQITLQFAAPVAEPQIFTTQNPARIAVDIPDTHDAMTKRRIDINTGATQSVTAVEAAGRTRVVVDLFHNAGYETRKEGNNYILTINNTMSGGAASATAAAVAATDQTKSSVATGMEITNVDFRRGQHGEGRVIVTFSGQGAGVDLQRLGDKIDVNMYNVKLPAQFAQKLDVLDFATPVKSIETHRKGGGVEMEITAGGSFDQLAYQSGNEYIIEVSPKKEEAKVDPNAPPVYSGNRVTFNFQDIPTRSVLQLIADVSDLNIVVSDSVGGNVTLRLINVPWDQALDLVLQTKGLDKRQNGNVIWIAPQHEIAAREQAIAEAHQKLQDVKQTVTVYIPISYGKAKDIAALLSSRQGAGGSGGSAQGGGGFLSPRGRVTADDRTNTLLVVDTPERVEEVRNLVSKLDKPVQQVLIESRVVVATDNFARELGAKFGISGGYQTGNTIVSTSGSLAAADQMSNIALANRVAGLGGLPISSPGTVGAGIQVPNIGNRLNVNLPASNSTGSFGLAILGADYLLDLELSAAQTEGRSELISSPRVITANQQEADIKQGSEIGYVTFTGGTAGGGASTATVQFKEAVLELKVTPTITADNRVYLTLDVKKDAINQLVPNPGGGFVPQLDKREITTSVLVDNGQTVVLGGVYEFDKSTDIAKVPFLGDIPGLGALFRDTKKKNSKAELLIFVTPRILNESLK
ncbi:MAG: type IV pilus secretin family protein [Xanthomonadales bacterium PRO7]|nr:type IV pilus secretin family protein [Xanthomonadales bacterium PRO7]